MTQLKHNPKKSSSCSLYPSSIFSRKKIVIRFLFFLSFYFILTALHMFTVAFLPWGYARPAVQKIGLADKVDFSDKYIGMRPVY